MARVKGGSVSVELVLDKDQFNKDFKAAGREVVAMQKQLSLELERNKVKFAVDGMDKDWADKLFGNTVIGKIRAASRETQFLNTQISFQRNKVDVAKASWDALTATKGATSGAAITAEKSFLREQMALVGLQKQLDSTASASMVTAGSVKNIAVVTATAAAAIATAYATMAKAATAWGQSVNDVVDATGMGDEAAAKLLGTMNIVGLSTEDATGALVKMARSVDAAFKAQVAAAKMGKDSEDVFTRFGIAIRDSSGNLLDQATILANIQTVHAGMRDGLEKTAMEMEIFGRSGYKLNDFLNLSKEQMAEYTQRIEKMGLAIGDSAKYENLNKQLNEMSLALKGIAVTITGDNIPAITQLITKMSELSAWAKENKDGLLDLRDTIATLGEWVAKPFVFGLEIGIAGIKKFVEAVNDAKQASKEPIAESTLDDVAAAARIAEQATKRQADANRAQAAAAKDLIMAERELQDAILTLRGKTLEVTLKNIDREREAWIKKTQDEVEATKWAEEAKLKAVQDAIDSRLGAEVAAAKKAILEGKSVSEAISAASKQRMNEERATYEARDYVKKYYGIKEPGDEIRTLNVDYDTNTISQIKEIAKSVVIPRDANGRTVFDPYKPVRPPDVYTDENGNRTNGIPQGQPGSIFITVPVNVDGQQLGQAAAKVILPRVQSNPTAYGGNNE